MTTSVAELFAGETGQRLGWALIHFVWQGAVAALLLAGLLRAWRRRSAQARWLASCIVLGLMALMPVMTALVVTVNPTGKAALAIVALPPAPALPAAPRPPEAVAPTPMTMPAPMPAVDAPAATVEVRGVPWHRQAVAWMDGAMPWLPAAWLMGVLVLSVWHAGGWLQVERAKRRGTRAVGGAVRDVFQRLVVRLQVNRAVRLLESARVAVPVVVGWLRPVVLMPASLLTGLAPAQLEAILAHELAHVRRYDGLVRLLQAAVETLLFYHPAVWWVSRRITEESELCCDELAVAACGDRQGYAAALARVAELGRNRPQLAAAASGGSLVTRIRRILGVPDPVRPSAAASAAAVLLVVAVLAVSIALSVSCRTTGVMPAADAPADKSAAPAIQGDTQLLQTVAKAIQENGSRIHTWQGKATFRDELFQPSTTYLTVKDGTFVYDLEHAKSRWRLTITEHQESPKGITLADIPNEMNSGAGMSTGDGYYYLLNPGSVVGVIGPLQEGLFILSREETATGRFQKMCAFDPRTYMTFRGLDLGQWLMERCDGGPAGRKGESVERRGDLVVYRYTDDDDGGTVYAYTFDLSKGGNVVDVRSTNEETRPGGVDHYIYEYVRVEGVWLPQAFRREVVGKGNDVSYRLVEQARFTENVVNRAIPATEFTTAALGVKEGCPVSDQRLGTSYKYTGTLPEAPPAAPLNLEEKTLAVVTGMAEVRGGLAYVSLGESNANDATLKKLVEALKRVDRTTILNLANTRITDAGLADVVDLKSLEDLNLGHTRVTDAGLKDLKKMLGLKSLHLGGDAITDAGLKDLKELVNLSSLGLPSTRITDAGLKELTVLQNLTWLDLSDTRITDAGLKELKAFPKLQVLFINNTRVTDVGLEELKARENLTFVNLGGTCATNAGVQALEKAKPLLKVEWGAVVHEVKFAADFKDSRVVAIVKNLLPQVEKVAGCAPGSVLVETGFSENGFFVSGPASGVKVIEALLAPLGPGANTAATARSEAIRDVSAVNPADGEALKKLIATFDAATAKPAVAPAASWHLVAKNAMASVEAEKVLYDQQPPSPYFFIRVRVTNTSDGPIGVDLRDDNKVIYPNQWGEDLEKPERGAINEERQVFSPMTDAQKTQLIEDFKSGRLVRLEKGQAVDYYRDFNSSSAGKPSGKQYTCISLDGQLQMSDGTRTGRITCDDNNAGKVLSEGGNDTTVYLPPDVVWGKIPDGALVFADGKVSGKPVVQSAEAKAAGPRVEVSISVPTAKSLVDAAVEVRYRNLGNEDLTFQPPLDPGGPLGPVFYRGLKATDGLGTDLKYMRKAKDPTQPLVPPVTIKAKGDYTFSFRLLSVWEMPLQWGLIELQATDLDQPAGKAGMVKVVNADERFLFAAEIIRGADTNIKEIRFKRLYGAKAKALITIKKGSDPAAPALTVSFTNTGKDDLWVPIPEGKDLPLYLGLNLAADGKAVPRIEADIDEVVISKEKRLAPGETVSFDVPTVAVWKMPAKWESLEVHLTGGHGPGSVAGSAEIEGDSKFVFHRKDVADECQRVRDSVEALLASATAEKPAAAKAAEPPWGEADQGLRVALRPEKQEWKVGETPRLLADISNTGDKSFQILQTEQLMIWELEVDGQWYKWNGPVLDPPVPAVLAPKGVFSGIPVTIDTSWNAKDGGKPLVLTPGRHIVRVAEPSVSVPDGKVTARPVSRAVTFEVSPAGAKVVADKPADAKPAAAPAAPSASSTAETKPAP